jgi:predicted PurR-regulated permease PerM
MKHNEITLGRFLRIVMLVAAIAVAYFVLDSLSGVLLPFAIAWLLAYLLQPLVSFIQHKLKVKYRMLSIIVALLLICLFVYGCLMLVVPSLLEEIFELKDLILSLINKGLTNSTIPQPVMEFFMDLVDENYFKSLLNTEFGSEINSMLLERVQMIIFGTVDVIQALFAFFIILLYLFFILMDYEKISDGWIHLIPVGKRDFANMVANDVKSGMNAYFRGQSLIALLVGILFSIGFLIIDFPMAIGLGLFIGVLNLIPYMQTVGFIPTLILAFVKANDSGQNFWIVLLCALAVFVVVQAIQDLILTPRIMGSAMGLNPAIILLSLSVWGSLLGIIGLIIAPPLTTLLISYYRRFVIKETDEETPKQADKE